AVVLVAPAALDDLLGRRDDHLAWLGPRPVDRLRDAGHERPYGVRVALDEVGTEDVAAGREPAQQVVVGEQRMDPAPRQRLVPQRSAEYGHVELALPQ